jgi:DNA primase
VAPLGTAITQGQLELMWRVTPEPLIALDGDTAGLRAAYRLIDLALPLLQAGRSLRFILMPEGQDPDDLIRAKGAAAVQTLVEQAMPLVDLLWRRETEGKVFDSPERKASLDKTLREKLSQIQDTGLRRHYGDAIKELRYTLFRPNRGSFSGSWKGKARAHALTSTKSSMLAAAPEDMSIKLHQGVILAGLIKVPELIPVFLDDLADMQCSDGDFDRLRQSVMGAVGHETLEEDLRETYGNDVLEALFGLPHVAISPAMRSVTDVERVEMTIAEGFAKITALRGVEQEVSEAIEYGSDAFEDDRILWRLGQAALQKEHAQRPQQADKAIYEVGENGVRIDKKERDALDALLGAIKFQKK